MTPTLAAAQGFERDLMIVLACAALISLLMSRLRVATIPGYLIAGIIIGPSALGLVNDAGSINAVGHYALIVLMFAIGMHLNIASLRHGAVSIVSTGVLSTLSATALFWAILAPSPLGPKGALAAGMGLALSSTAVVLRLMSQKRKLHTANGRASLGVLLIQDLIVIVYLSILPLLAVQDPDTESASKGMNSAQDAVIAIAVVGALILIGRRALPRLLYAAAKFGGQEVMLVLTAAVALFAALVTAKLGLSAELGAFIAGFLLASTPFRHELSGQLAPIRDIFMALFFTAIGLQVDLEAILPVWWIVPLGVLALIVIKALNIALTARICGAETALSFRMGMTLAQTGEFSLIVFAAASDLDIISDDHTSILIAIVIASLILTPTIMGLGTRTGILAQRYLDKVTRRFPTALRDSDGVEIPNPPRVLVAGYGVIGRACVEKLQSSGITCAVIELNQNTVAFLKREGTHAVFGDISNPEVLESAGIEHARVVVLAMPDSDATMSAVRTIRAIDPKIHIAVRVAVQPRAALAEHLGADVVVVEETVAADVLAAKVLTGAKDLSAQLVPDEPGSTPGTPPESQE